MKTSGTQCPLPSWRKFTNYWNRTLATSMPIALSLLTHVIKVQFCRCLLGETKSVSFTVIGSVRWSQIRIASSLPQGRGGLPRERCPTFKEVWELATRGCSLRHEPQETKDCLLLCWHGWAGGNGNWGTFSGFRQTDACTPSNPWCSPDQHNHCKACMSNYHMSCMSGTDDRVIADQANGPNYEALYVWATMQSLVVSSVLRLAHSTVIS